MKKRTLALLAAAAAVGPAVQAQNADTGNWIVRARAVYLDSENKDSTGVGLSVNNKAFPELDVTYFFSPNLAAELILTYPQEHDVKAGGAVIGSLKQLPPTLTLQYHFTGLNGFRPYVGAGVNYTRLSDVQLPSPFSIEKDSWGFAAQAGVDVPLGGGWLLNFDVKKIQIGFNVSASGVEAGTFDLDPWVWGIGFGKRF